MQPCCSEGLKKHLPGVDELIGHFERLRPFVVRHANGFIKFPYCVPGGFYREQWDWDGFFTACHLASRTPFRPEYLKYWTLNALSAVLADGTVPARVRPEGPSPEYCSPRMKPFLAQGAELGARLLDEYEWVKDNYDTIVRNVTLRETANFIAEAGLFVWDDAVQSGAGNNPAVHTGHESGRSIIACDMNAFQYREYVALSRLAGKVGRRDDVALFAEKAAALKLSLNRILWDDGDESYWNLSTETGEWCKRVSYSNFVPLWAGLAPGDRASAMIRRYLWNDDHMLTRFGLRSLSGLDPEYNNVDTDESYPNWQGPIWPIANYFYFVGLMHYGFREEARELVRRLIKVYLRDIEFCGSLHKNYDADTGRPLSPSAARSSHAQEGGYIGWNLLLQDMIEMLDGRANLLEL